MVVFVLILISAGHGSSGAQDIESSMAFSGVVYEEDMGAEQVEEIEDLLSRTLKVNYASRDRLLSSGIFTPYQVASLYDYRKRNGDILSFAELAAVDGFGVSFVERISKYLSLESPSLPGIPAGTSVMMYNSLIAKFSVKLPCGIPDEQENPAYGYGLKYRFSLNENIEAGFTMRSTYSGDLFPPESSSIYCVYYPRGFLEKLIVGDFNARFGQGLAMWSGFSMSGVPSAGSFSKRVSGISPSWSYSGDSGHRGVAADFRAGDFLVSAFVSSPEWRKSVFWKIPDAVTVLPGINVFWLGMNGQASVTCFARSPGPALRNKSNAIFETCHIALDGRCSIRGTELFAEVASELYSGAVAALAGCRSCLWEVLDMAAALRYYPSGYISEFSGAVRGGSRCSNEYGASVSASVAVGKYVELRGRTGFGSSVKRNSSDFRIDVLYSPDMRYGTSGPSYQIKAMVAHSWQLSPSFSLLFRASERVRSYGRKTRTDLRCDFRYSNGIFSASARVNCLKCAGVGLLGYMEGGLKTGKLNMWIRGGVFRIDNWDDRIYAYERDAPGNFSVPAYYGRGFWCAFSGGVKLPSGFKIYLKGSYVGYPWISPASEKKKPGRAELKIQFNADLNTLVRS